MKKQGSAADPQWYKDAVIYELHVRSFADSNGDGIGDFAGLTARLDYLKQLGVNCLWLLPFFPSPMCDDGYDISGYTDVHPAYGTLDDFTRFVDSAHSRDMQVLIELVMNHTSDQHPWFQRARRAAAGSVEREFYVWSRSNTLFADAPIIFNDTEKSNWAWDDLAGEYYWHRFFSHQPDLNYDNPAVLDEMFSVIRFWLDRGVDGLRLDAIPYLVERDGTRCENLPESHEIIRQVRALIDSEYTNRFLLAEANQWPSDVRPYFGNGDECHMAFHFPLMPRIYVALRQEDRQPIVDIMQQTPELPPICQWALFLRNHDELTLEMVTRDERDYMYLAYSSDPRTRINLGIRRRLAPLLDNRRERIELLNALLLSLPGTPVLYYGDEIGMGDNLDLGDRNGVRTPMQWSSELYGGFSSSDPALHGNPVISDPVYGFQAVNVKEQIDNPSSLLQWTRRMIQLRQLFPLFGRGTLRFLFPSNRKVLVYIRQLGEEIVLCLANLSRFAQPVTVDLSEFHGRTPVEVIGYTPFPLIADGPYSFTLSPYATLWFELQAQFSRHTLPLTDSTVAEVQDTALDSVAHASIEAEPHLLLSLDSAEPKSILATVQTLLQKLVEHSLPYRVTLAYPLRESAVSAIDAASLAEQLSAAIPPDFRSALALAPYTPSPDTLPDAWPHSLHNFLELARHATEKPATAVMLCGTAEDFCFEDCAELAKAIMLSHCDLAMPVYRTSRYEGLVNMSILRPYTTALYGAEILFPLAPDIALSTRFLDHLCSDGASTSRSRGSVFGVGLDSAPDERLVWPATDAVVHSFRIAQVQVGPRGFRQSMTIGFTELMTRILNSLFAETDRHAGYWQRSLPLPMVRNIDRSSNDNSMEFEVEDDHRLQTENIASMLDSFLLAKAHLQELWSQALSPGTMLALKRVAESGRDSFHLPDALWGRIVFEFAAAYHNRSVNRQHISGALVPLYSGWAASYLKELPTLSRNQLEQRRLALCGAFAANKQHLMSLWRWPDRFTP